MIQLLTGNRALRPVQLQALEKGLFSERKNLIVSAPTNSGKSLVGLLALLQAIADGKRAILLEPLRALAREKADELERLAPALGDFLGRSVSVKITTGDYRLDNETFSDPAPMGELIIATPERLEAVLRNPDNQVWLNTVGVVCIDEAHLIGNPHRGPILEYLITSLLYRHVPPRIVLLSATLSSLDRLQAWLKPCEVVKVTERYPALHKSVLELGFDDDPDMAIAGWLDEQLDEDSNQALVFVYQTNSTTKLATLLTKQLGAKSGKIGALAYHAQMSQAQRLQVKQAFLEGQCRIVVTTSALAMGINLPATHVVVRDLTYPNACSPDVADLLQMMGRAGRGDQEGRALVIKRPHDGWNSEELRRALQNETLPEFRSAFALDRGRDQSVPVAASAVASLLARRIKRRPDDHQPNKDREMTQHELEDFLGHSLGGRQLVAQVRPALTWLEMQTLAYQGEHGYGLTVLGERATRAVLPLPLAAGFAQLIRDLLSVDPEDRLLASWRPMDHLLVLNLLHDRTPNLKSFSEALGERITGWCEGHGQQAPMLFRDTIMGKRGHSRAIELIGSLGLHPPKPGTAGEEWARKQAYLATFNAILVQERSQGQSIERLERQFDIKNLAGIEERWRDELLWLLSGLGRLLDLRTFYFHLKEECQANLNRIKRVKHILRTLRYQTYDLQEQLKYCSPLGPLLRQVRNVKGNRPGIGIQTLRNLEEAGVTSIKEIYDLGFEGLVQKGIRRDIAKRIVVHLKRRRV